MDCKTAQQKIMPYIERKLSDREMEDFIEHILECETCSEELEVYFTIYYALENLEKDGQGSYNMKELLKQDLERAHKHVRNRNILRFYKRFFIAVMCLVATIFLVTGIQSLIRGSFEKTTLYNLFHEESETVSEPVTRERGSDLTVTEKAEPETNWKRQIIVTTPETEAPTTGAVSLGTEQSGKEQEKNAGKISAD